VARVLSKPKTKSTRCAHPSNWAVRAGIGVCVRALKRCVRRAHHPGKMMHFHVASPADEPNQSLDREARVVGQPTDTRRMAVQSDDRFMRGGAIARPSGCRYRRGQPADPSLHQHQSTKTQEQLRKHRPDLLGTGLVDRSASVFRSPRVTHDAQPYVVTRALN
jgi:hypothetical protein